MKKFRSIISVLLTVMMVALCLPLTAFGATQTVDLIDLSDDSNISVVIDYESEKPSVSFVTPDGKTWGESNKNVTVVEDGKSINYQIRNAKAGQWKIKYDKKSNDSLDYSAVAFEDGIYIDSLSIGKVKDSYLPVNFVVNCDSEHYYNYTISAVTDKSIKAGREIYSGSAKTDEKVSVDAPLYNLSTYDKYYILVEVRYTGANDELIFDSMVCDTTFSFTNSESPDAYDKYSVVVNLTTKVLSVDITPPEDEYFYFDKCLVALFKKGDDKTPINYQELYGDERIANLAIDTSDSSEFYVAVNYINNGITSKTSKRSFKVKDAKNTAKIVTPEVTSSSQVEISYTMSEKVTAIVGINDDISEISINKGSSTVSTVIEEGVNNVFFEYPIAEGVSARIEKEITVDKSVPILDLYENLNHIVTSKKTYTIVGEVSGASKLLIAGNEVPIDKNGCFKYEAKLNFGENVIKIEALNGSGVSTAAFAVIEQTSPVASINNASVLDFLPLIIACILFAVLMMLYLALVKKKDNVNEERERFSVKALKAVIAILASLSVVDVALLVWRIIARNQIKALLNSYDFYTMAESSFDEAYSKIEAYNRSLYEIIALAVALVVIIVFIVLFARLLGKEKKKPKLPPKPKKPAKPIRPVKPIVPQAKQVENKPVEKPIAPPIKQPRQENKPFFCPACGTKYDKKPPFCGKCGKKID